MHLTLKMAETRSRNEINQRHTAYLNAVIYNDIMLKKMKNLGQMLNETGYHDYCHKPGLPQAKHGV